MWLVLSLFLHPRYELLNRHTRFYIENILLFSDMLLFHLNMLHALTHLCKVHKFCNVFLCHHFCTLIQRNRGFLFRHKLNICGYYSPHHLQMYDPSARTLLHNHDISDSACHLHRQAMVGQCNRGCRFLHNQCSLSFYNNCPRRNLERRYVFHRLVQYHRLLPPR